MPVAQADARAIPVMADNNLNASDTGSGQLSTPWAEAGAHGRAGHEQGAV